MGTGREWAIGAREKFKKKLVRVRRRKTKFLKERRRSEFRITGPTAKTLSTLSLQPFKKEDQEGGISTII